MDIYDTWKLYKDKMEAEISKFNEATKKNDFETMKIAKDATKSYYQKFIALLQCESEYDKKSFNATLDEFLNDLKKMSDYIKNNEGKKVLNNKEESSIKSNLDGVVVR